MLTSSQIATTAVAALLGLGTLGSYVPLITDQVKGTYDYWLGFPQSNRTMFYVFQVFAAAGFLTFFADYLKSAPAEQGLLSHSPAIVPVVVGVLLAACLIWGIGIVQYMRAPSSWLKWMVAGSLVITGLCSILLLAGYAETKEPKWYVLLGLLLFSIVTVLADGVMWNARFILNY